MKCPHCGHELLNGEDFSLKPVTRASLIRPKSGVIGLGATVISLPAIGGEVEVRTSAVKDWAETYPAVDIPATLREIRSWLNANPTHRKSNVARFVNNWLKREQDRG